MALGISWREGTGGPQHQASAEERGEVELWSSASAGERGQVELWSSASGISWSDRTGGGGQKRIPIISVIITAPGLAGHGVWCGKSQELILATLP